MEERRRSIGGTPKEHRRSIRGTSEKRWGNIKGYRSPDGVRLNETQEKILELLSRDTKLSASKLAEQIGITSRNIEINIKKLKDQGILIRHGSPKSGYWEVVIIHQELLQDNL